MRRSSASCRPWYCRAKESSRLSDGAARRTPRLSSLIVYDWGCGRYPEVIGDFLKCKNIKYIGYDPYWYPDGYRNYPDEGYGFPSADVFICSNVLNVICDWTEVKRISQMLRNQYRPFFITVYEGTKSYIGQETRKDCWQWNKPIESYIMNHKDVIKKKILTNEKYKS